LAEPLLRLREEEAKNVNNIAASLEEEAIKHKQEQMGIKAEGDEEGPGGKKPKDLGKLAKRAAVRGLSTPFGGLRKQVYQ
jgi:hypothetical protein